MATWDEVVSRITGSLRANIDVYGDSPTMYHVKCHIWDESEASGPINDSINDVYRGNSPEDAIRAISHFWKMRENNEI
jgi:hypothetical protein